MTVQIVITAKLLFHQAWILQRGDSQRLGSAASVDTIHAPGDKGSQVRGEKDDHVRHFFRRPQPTQWQSTQTQFVAHSFLWRQSVLHGKVAREASWSRPDEAWCYDVHTNAACAFRLREYLGQARTLVLEAA
jgi:hypothetical protein